MSLQKLFTARVATVFVMLFVCVGLYAQNITVKGTVKDSNGDPVVGAAVLIKGTQTGVTTDIDGNYAINVPSNATLRFTALSYADQEVPVRGRANISVVLSEDSERLAEATVTAEFGMKRVPGPCLRYDHHLHRWCSWFLYLCNPAFRHLYLR